MTIEMASANADTVRQPKSRPWVASRLLPSLLLVMIFAMTSTMLGLMLSFSNPTPAEQAPSFPETPLDELPPGRHRLTLRGATSFTIAIFADLHYGEEENGWGIDQDRNSTVVMRSVLANESPDLVVINGDLITGENTFKENASDYVQQIVKPVVDANLPFASTYGNHDSKFNLSRETTFKTETTYPLCYTQRMDPELPGISNYYLLVHLPDGGAPAAVLWFFDSRGGASYQHEPANEDDIPNWVADETAQWFQDTSASIRRRFGKQPSLAFVHIPPHVFLSAQKTGLDPSHFPGVNEDVPVAIQGEGSNDQAFVDALLAEEGLHSIYVGHDHGNAWCAMWPEQGRFRLQKHHGDEENKRPFLCFSKHTGYGGYGTWNRGARLIHLDFHDDNDDGDFNEEGEMQVHTWVRMEDGSKVTSVTLNETYGIDTYSTENGG